jgi:hypothetical protein
MRDMKMPAPRLADFVNYRFFSMLKVAGGLGFEPRFSESESDVLPLNYPPIVQVYQSLEDVA